MGKFYSTKTYGNDRGLSCCFRQWRSTHSHCSLLHGYSIGVKFVFECVSLDERNWVVDFGGLKELEKILKNQFDHTLCIDSKDPLLDKFIQLHDGGGCDLRIMDGVGIEKTAEWCFKTAQEHITKITHGRCWVMSVEVWEHERNSAVYSEN